MDSTNFKKWICLVCGWIYDEELGDVESGLAAGTRWQDVPEDWVCPDCGEPKNKFVMVEVQSAQKIRSKMVAIKAPNFNKFILPIIVIGSGIAGLSQIRAIRKHHKNVPILMICNDDGEEYSKPVLSTSLTYGKEPKQLVRAESTKLETRLNTNILKNTHIVGIDIIKKCVVTDKQKEYKYSKLVLAVGADSNRLDINTIKVVPNGIEDEIIYINSLRDYRIFRKKFASANNILIIGSGLIGCEFVNDVYNFNCNNSGKIKNISVVGIEAYPMASVLPEKAGKLLQSSLKVDWNLNCSIKSISKDNNDKYNVHLSSGKVIVTDMLLGAIGLHPNLELAKKTKLKIDRGIVVNDNLQTSNQHIYAIGDCTQFKNMVLPYIAPIQHQTEVVVESMLGMRTKLIYPPMPVVVKVPCIGLTFLAPPRLSKIKWNVIQTDGGLKATNLGRKGRINGFVLMGNRTNEVADILKKVDLSS